MKKNSFFSIGILIVTLIVFFHFPLHAQDNSDNTQESPITEEGPDNTVDAGSETEDNANQDSESDDNNEDEEVSQKEDFNVKWYLPELGVSTKNKRTRVILSGKTTPKSKVKIGSKKIPLINSKRKIVYLSRKSALTTKNSVVTADETGYFELILDLPRMGAQLPIMVKSPSGTVKKFQLSLRVKSEEVKIKTNEKLQRSPKYAKKNNLWFGLGMNYLIYKQSQNSTPSLSLEFQSLKAPSFYFQYDRKINENIYLLTTGKSSPGETSSSTNTVVNQGSYNWLTFSFEGLHYPTSWSSTFMDKPSNWGYRVGLQHHIVPFLYSVAISGNTTTVTIKTNSLTMMTLGTEYTLQFKPRWSFEFFMRYQHPLATGNVFTIKPSFAFDGSLGVIWDYKENLKFSTFWYGQMQKYGFTYQPFGSDVTGDQTLFFSNLEFRVGYSF